MVACALVLQEVLHACGAPYPGRDRQHLITVEQKQHAVFAEFGTRCLSHAKP